jgi:hypothetical protein
MRDPVLKVHRPDGREIQLSADDVVFVEPVERRDCGAKIVLASIDRDGDNEALLVVEDASEIADRLVNLTGSSAPAPG